MQQRMGPAVDGDVSAADVAAVGGEVQQTPDRLIRSDPVPRATGNGVTLPAAYSQKLAIHGPPQRCTAGGTLPAVGGALATTNWHKLVAPTPTPKRQRSQPDHCGQYAEQREHDAHGAKRQMVPAGPPTVVGGPVTRVASRDADKAAKYTKSAAAVLASLALAQTTRERQSGATPLPPQPPSTGPQPMAEYKAFEIEAVRDESASPTLRSITCTTRCASRCRAHSRHLVLH
jgi:hypothetical protein